jgi:hypothetical protein
MKTLLKFGWIVLVFMACSKDEDLNIDENHIDKWLNQKITGSSSHDLLSDDRYKSMLIELVYVQGQKPSQSSVDNFVEFIKNRTYKPNGIIVESRAITASGKSNYTIEDIVSIEDANRTNYNLDDQIALWVYFSDGVSSEDTDSTTVLGTAYRNTSFVIYQQSIQKFSDDAFGPSRELLETTVITHEFGHILGLTNFGATMVENHEDAEHERHCDNESCLMYWAAESGTGLANLTGASSAPGLDDQCISDLRANGGK